MYIIDTDICIYLIKKHSPDLIKKFEDKSVDDVGISAVTAAELEFGIAKSMYPDKNRTALLEFLSEFNIIPFDARDTQVYGITRACLEKQGIPIGPYDLQIAAQCLARNHILVTNNVREFSRVPGLKIENWVK